MLFIATFKIKAGDSTTLNEYLSRRMQGTSLGEAPTEGRFEGIEIVGEYLLQSTDPRIILIFESDSNSPILELVSEWDDQYDITVVPAVSAADVMLS